MSFYKREVSLLCDCFFQFSPNEDIQLLAVSSWEGSVRIYHFPAGPVTALEKRSYTHAKPVLACTFFVSCSFCYNDFQTTDFASVCSLVRNHICCDYKVLLIFIYALGCYFYDAMIGHFSSKSRMEFLFMQQKTLFCRVRTILLAVAWIT